MLRAFHNDPLIQATYLARVRHHRAADEIIHGQYWEHGKGCAVGCTVHSGRHEAYETELGIPQRLARLEDRIFEGLVAPRDVAWPEEFLTAIPLGADLRMIWPRFVLALLSDSQYGALHYVRHNKYARQIRIVEEIVSLYQGWIETGIRPAHALAPADAAVDIAYVADGRQEQRVWQAETLLSLLRAAPQPPPE